MSKCDTVVFDLDGTLLDTLDDLAASVNFALRSAGLPPRGREEVRRFLGNGIRRLMTDATGGRLDGESFEEAFQTFRRHYVAHCLDRTRPYPGVMEMMETLDRRGVRMAIVSNKLHPAVEELNRRFFSRFIDVAVGESPTVRRKPHPDAVLQALDRLGRPKESAVYVGDSEVDLATARNAGMACALVTWGFRDEACLRALPGATVFLQRPADLPALLAAECFPAVAGPESPSSKPDLRCPEP